MKINEKNLCVFARTPPYDMEGFLYKRGEVNKAFQRRYFVLKGNLLFYFETRLDKEPLGLIIVEGCTIELSLEPDVDNYCFMIVFNGNRSYILAADTQESMELWMKALTCAGYEYKRIIVSELQRQLQEIEDSRKKVNDDSNAPKPPPRGRINPFNRPAPPVPSTVIHEVGAIPFANGHFGSSKAQQELSHRETGNGSPHRTPKPLVPPRGASPSVFYADSPETVLPIRNNINTADPNSHAAVDSMERRRQRLALAMEQFKKEHEAYRKEVMPDIVAYRRTRKQPLIQF